jgi:cytochrome d ubiquinol oxidase subunit II
MSLSDVWFVLFSLIIAGYLILDGFDMGVGILYPIIARTDPERRLVLNSIGPIWDGNEVWIVLGGGVLFAAFPLVYASLFSGFYAAFMLVLLVMILRTVAIEFRSKRGGTGWRTLWDMVFALTSLGLALLLGVAFGNIISGVDLDQDGNINESLLDLLNPYALLIGVTAVVMFAVHGAIFLSMKVDGDVELRVHRYIPRMLAVFVALTTAVVIWTAVSKDQVSERYREDIWPVIFPAAALVACVLAWRMLSAGRHFLAFIASSAMIALLLLSGGAGMFPNLLISTINQDYNLTVDNAAAAANSLKVMLVVAIIGMPLVLLYTAGVYYFFRGKTELEPDSY